MSPGQREGVIKFVARHEHAPLDAAELSSEAAALFAWRDILRRLEMLGQTPGRYGGLGFGNLSARLPSRTRAAGRRRFLITGTQTAGLDVVAAEHLCIIEAYDIAANRVQSRGRTLPSSESLTHAALYDCDGELCFVFHVHAPAIWHAADALSLPATADGVEYGTQAMAEEMRRLWRRGQALRGRVVVMRGHEDGVVSFGRTAQEAGEALIRALALALASQSLHRSLGSQAGIA